MKLKFQRLAGVAAGQRGNLRLPAPVHVQAGEGQRFGDQQGAGPFQPHEALRSDPWQPPRLPGLQRRQGSDHHGSLSARQGLGKLEADKPPCGALPFPRGPGNLLGPQPDVDQLQTFVQLQDQLLQRLALDIQADGGGQFQAVQPQGVLIRLT